MSVFKTYQCDGPDCGSSWSGSATGLPASVALHEDGWPARHFCTSDCLMRYFAARPPAVVETIPFKPPEDGES